jgi:hypothetical protein
MALPLLLLPLLQAAGTTAAPKPSVIHIIADDYGWNE